MYKILQDFFFPFIITVCFALLVYNKSYSQTPDASGIVYVKKGATGNGSSWTSPTGELADALKAAKTNTNIRQIWVAKGTYYPLYSPQDGTDFGTDKGRDNAFLLIKDVKIYGGFDPDKNIRDLQGKRIEPSATTGSILSGDFSNNDVLSGSDATLAIANNTENAYHVVVSTGDIGTALLDGFTITGGNADNKTGSLMVNSKEIDRSTGGGIYTYTSSPTFSNVVVCKNTAVNNGGGVANLVEANPVFVSTLIIKNIAANGGGVYNAAVSSPVFRNTVIALNTVVGTGSAAYSNDGAPGKTSTPKFYNSVVYNNSSSYGAALAFRNYPYNLTTFSSANSLIQSETSTANGNIKGDTDPKFTNAANDNYTLANGSPLINKGNNSYVTEPFDLAGNARIRNATVDIGAYEVQSGSTIAYTKTNPVISEYEAIIKTYGDAGFILNAPISTSSGTFSYFSTKESVATINGNAVTIKGAGTMTVIVTQAGTPKHNAVTTSLTTITVNKANPVFSNADDITKTYGDANFVPEITSTSNGAFTYASSNEDVAVITDNKITIVGTGTATITATQKATANYNSGSINFDLTVDKADPVLSDFTDINKTYDDASFTITAPISTSSGTFTYSSSNTAVASISGSIVTIKGAGTATITATQASTANYNAASVDLTLTVDKADPILSGFAAINKTYGDANFAITAPTSTSSGTFTYSSSNTAVATISGSTVTIKGAGTATITATQASTANYNAASVDLTLTVDKADPVLSGFAAINKTYSDANFALTAPTSTSSGTFTYSSSNEDVATISSNMVSIHGVGTTMISAIQAPTDNYNTGGISLKLTVVEKTLSVSLLSFTAKVENNKAKLEWSTAYEQNNREFIIYRSHNGKEFILDTVSGIGNSSTIQNYSYDDENPLHGVNYYKLVQVDRNGKPTELGVRTANFSLEGANFLFSPNPTEDIINISFDKGQYRMLNLTDLNGKLLQQIQINPGEGSLVVSLGSCSTGIYLLHLDGDKGKITKKVIRK
ncbi:T9SS type A sorting domain-containing protein [Pseudopedobacter beijingensis]|uniref:T9SS type A sorting domain-containing protein n=1 Tax=Pseudopedobacter beijingensis TaxID=1207056 RepID=A0ABW4IC03_9SPHI